MSQSRNWYDDPVALAAAVRQTVKSAAPEVPGYDDLMEIARGGQGVVFQAVQRSTRRRVAIKVLLNGDLASGAARRRFEREIDLVSRLRHPNIVSVYDSGLTPDGRLYLVMEFVEGTALADQGMQGARSRAEARAILESFAAVCDGVSYAHQHGVIHRDLKPRNIRIDSSGQPRVLDFGLAKVAGETDGRTLSVTGQFLGSLPWASPEQASGNPDGVDVRSDVYSLGVILYQWLAGTMPYEIGTSLGEALTAISSAEPTNPAGMREGIDGELATIVLKCLAKSPERRYQSAGEVALDVRRYLAGEPIQAKRDSAWYTLRKKARRYRIVTAAAGAVAVVTLGALFISLRALDRAHQERARAEDQSALSGTVTEFLREMLAAADPDKDGRDVKVLTLVDRAGATIPQRFGDRPALAGTIYTTLAELYGTLLQHEAAMAQFTLAAGAFARADGVDTRRPLHSQAMAAALLHKLGRSQESIDQLNAIYEKQRRVLGENDIDTISTLGEIAQATGALGRHAEAEAMLRRAIRATDALPAARWDVQAELHGRLGSALGEQGNLKESEAEQRIAVECATRQWGPESAQVIIAKNNLGVTLIDLGRLDEAEATFRDLIEVAERRHGADSENTIGLVNNLAKIIQDRGRYAECGPMMKRVYETRRNALGEGHQLTLVAMNNYASNLAFEKRYEEAITLQRRLLEIRRAKLGPDHWDTLLTLNNLGGSLRDAGRLDEAAESAQAAAEGARRTLGPDHFATWLFSMNLGRVYLLRGEAALAEPLLSDAAARIEPKFGPTHMYTRNAWTNLAKLYEAQGRTELAREFRMKLDQIPANAAK